MPDVLDVRRPHCQPALSLHSVLGRFIMRELSVCWRPPGFDYTRRYKGQVGELIKSDKNPQLADTFTRLAIFQRTATNSESTTRPIQAILNTRPSPKLLKDPAQWGCVQNYYAVY